jgi:hypothetical protein
VTYQQQNTADKENINDLKYCWKWRSAP